MLKIGTTKDLHKISYLPIEVQKSICEDVRMLDDNYGEDRDIDKDMGGFVVIFDGEDDEKIANFERENEAPEFIQEICPYRKSLYIAGTERHIIIYERI